MLPVALTMYGYIVDVLNILPNTKLPDVAGCVIKRFAVSPGLIFVASNLVVAELANVKVKKLPLLISILAVLDVIDKATIFPYALPVITTLPVIVSVPMNVLLPVVAALPVKLIKDDVTFANVANFVLTLAVNGFVNAVDADA